MILSQVSSKSQASRCSCVGCDSADCFTKRDVKEMCSCEMCYNSQTCLFPHKYDYSLCIPEPSKVVKSECSSCRTPIVIEPDLSKRSDAALNPVVSFDEKAPKPLEKVASKPSTTAKNPKPSKIPISTDNVLLKSYSITKVTKRKKNGSTVSTSCTKTTKTYQKDTSGLSSTQKPKVIEKCISKSSNIEIPKVISDHNIKQTIDLQNLREKLVTELVKKEVIYVYDRHNNSQTVTTKESKVSFRNIQTDNNKSIDADNSKSNNVDEVSIVNSVEVKYSKRDIEFAQSTARLAAQIMNMPYSDFKSTIPERQSSVLQQVSKYPIDILKRIKEAYKACSCKVCECIAGKAIITKDTCKCKPCDCNDCKRLTVSVLDSVCFPNDNDGCACIRCDRKDCKGIVKKNKAQPGICDCQINESETKFQTACACDPCQCLDCNLKTIRQGDVVIARVNENHRNSMCDCSPCECAECARSYGMSSEGGTTARREMSTGVNRHPRCQCEACITEACVPDGNESCWCVRHSKVMSKPFQRDSTDYDICRANLLSCFEPKDSNRNDTLTMYASITNTFPHKKINNRDKCYCDSCECLECNYKNGQECVSVLKEDSVTNYIGNGVEKKLSIKEKNGEYSLKITKNNCGCEICDCVSCTRRKTSKSQSSRKMCLAGTCNCSPCECLNLGNEMMEDGRPFYDCRQFLDDNDVNKQSVPQSYSTSRNINNPYSEGNVSMKTPMTNYIPTKDRGEINFFENYPYNRNSIQKKVMPQQYVSSRADNSSGVRNNSNKVETYFRELRQSPSLNSSISCLKDSESLLPISKSKKKSAESSCNSSGHDYADYLIHFPKTTVQKCIDDVMKSTNFINYINKPPSVISTSYKNALKNKPIPSPPLFRQLNNESQRAISNNCSFTTLSVASKHTCVSSKSSLHRTSGVIAIETNSKKLLSSQHIAIDGNMTDSQKLTIEENSPVVQPNKNEVPKMKKRVTVHSMHDDLERVQDTLTEAREFSKQLVKLLEKYENANKQFDAYKKIKMTDNTTKHSKMNLKKDTDMGSTLSCGSKNDIRLKKSLINTNTTTLQNKNQYKTSSKLLLENNQSKSSNSIRKLMDEKTKNDAISNENILQYKKSAKLLLQNNQSNSSNSIRKVVDEKTKNAAICNENILLGKTKKNKVSLNHFNKSDVSVITEPAYIFKTVTDNFNSLKSNNVKDFLNTIAEEKVSDILLDVYKANSEKKEKEQRKKRDFNYMYKRTMTMSKKMNIKPRYENVKLKASVVTEESKITPEGTEIKRNAVHASENDDLTNDISKYNMTDVRKKTNTKTNLQNKTNQSFLVIKSPENRLNYENAVLHASKNDNLIKNISKNNIKPTDVRKNTTYKTHLQNKTIRNQSFWVLKSPENKTDYENAVTNHPFVASKKYQLDTESNYGIEDIGPNLNFDLKEAIQSIPLEPETMAPDVQTVFCPDHNTLVSLQAEVKKLLNIPLLQPFMEKINHICNSKEYSVSKYTECPKTITAEKEVVQERSFSFYNKPLPRTMYNSMKVSYVNVRQVSDDSVVVKWDTPENVNNVEGYEVLVDGRSVHKIQSPNKCIAVVTGLHINDSDKILLSIRTLTNIPNIERMPATTIIYRPQVAIY